jgi:hypothetical protein
MIFEPIERVADAMGIKTQVTTNPAFANQRVCHFPIPTVIQPQTSIAQAGIPAQARSRGGKQAKKVAMLKISAIHDKRLVFMVPHTIASSSPI